VFFAKLFFKVAEGPLGCVKKSKIPGNLKVAATTDLKFISLVVAGFSLRRFSEIKN
jgi:hypothetical protein